MTGQGVVIAPVVFSLTRPPVLPTPNRRWGWQQRARVNREIRTATAWRAAGVKPVVDGLRDAGWLHDDGPEWLDLTVRQADGERAVIVVSVGGDG